jgi:hypothetical protein
METVVKFAKSLTLPELAGEITTFEAGKGPLIAMGRTAEETAATFQPGRHPAGDLKIGQAMPPTATKVCEGKIWESNVQVDAVAYRMPAD